MLRSALIVSVLRGLSASLALALGIVSAAYFGAGVEKDSYVVAQAIPNLLSMLLIGGLTTPLLVRLTEVGEMYGDRAQRELTRAAATRVTVVLGIVVALLWVGAEAIVAVSAPGFAASQRHLAASLLRITALTMAGTVLFNILKTFANSRHDFATPSLVGLLIGIVSLAGTVLTANRLGIFSLAAASCAGAAIALAVMGLLLRHPRSRLPGPGTAPMAPMGLAFLWSSFVPLSLGANFGQVNVVIDNAFASLLPAGSVTILGFAFVIVTGAESLTTFALAEVALPRMAAAAMRGTDALGAAVRSQIRAMWIITAPLTAGVMVFAGPLCRLLFQRGAFSAEATAAVASTLACYGPKFVLGGCTSLFWRLLIVRRRFKLLAWIAVGAIGLNAALDAVLIRHFGVAGIAVATSCVVALQSIAMAACVRREIGRIGTPAEATLLSKVALSGAIMAGAVALWATAFESLFSTASLASRLVEVAIGLGIGATVYLTSLALLGVDEIRLLPARVRRTTIFWRRT